MKWTLLIIANSIFGIILTVGLIIRLLIIPLFNFIIYKTKDEYSVEASIIDKKIKFIIRTKHKNMISRKIVLFSTVTECGTWLVGEMDRNFNRNGLGSIRGYLEFNEQFRKLGKEVVENLKNLDNEKQLQWQNTN